VDAQACPPFHDRLGSRPAHSPPTISGPVGLPNLPSEALLILQGHSSGSIGLRLGVSAQTVKVFRRQLYARCGISSQAELFALLLPLLTTKVA